MTRDELDDYLDSIGGLVNGMWAEPRPPITSNFFSTGDGWNQLIKELIEELMALGWDRKVTQVKEKFGGLRFYIGGGSKEVHDAINRAENKSYTICEDCGSPGKLRSNRYWELTLCDECNDIGKCKECHQVGFHKMDCGNKENAL